MTDERDYREERWSEREDADVDLDGCVCEGGDFEEWVNEIF